MKLIRIINGTYRHRPAGSQRRELKNVNSEPFAVDDAEAERLVAMEVAAYAETMETGKSVDSEDPYEKLSGALFGYIGSAGDTSAAIISALELLAQVAADAGVELSIGGVATPGGDENGEGAGVNSSGQENGAEGEENDEPPADDDDGSGAGDDDGDDIPEYNAEMSVAGLKEILMVCGLTYKVGMSRADMVAALDEYFASADDDGEAPPVLDPEEPVT